MSSSDSWQERTLGAWCGLCSLGSAFCHCDGGGGEGEAEARVAEPVGMELKPAGATAKVAVHLEEAQGHPGPLGKCRC